MRMRLRKAQNRNWGIQRDRVVAAYANAAARRIRTILNRERATLKRIAKAGGRAGYMDVNVGAMLQAIHQADPQVAQILRQALDGAGREAYRGAFELLGQVETAYQQALIDITLMRSVAVADKFAFVRADRLERLMTLAEQEGWTTGVLAEAIGNAFEAFSTGYLDGVARTEMAFMHEASVYSAWQESGIRQLDYVLSGGPCRTGVCEEAAAGAPYDIGSVLPTVGGSFDDMRQAPPLHPFCACFMVPYISLERQEKLDAAEFEIPDEPTAEPIPPAFS